SVNWEIELGRPRESLATRDNRVSSPNAAKTDAGACRCRRAFMPLGVLGDMTLDVFHLLGQTALVHTERFRAAAGRGLIKTGLGDGQDRAVFSLFQAEFDERGRLLRIIHFGIHG